MKYEEQLTDFDKSAFEVGREKIHHHTIQFLENGGKYGHKPHSTGVLVEIDSKYLIFSAAHVTEHLSENNTLYVITNKGLVPIKQS